MQMLSKICDAADWFDPEVLEVIEKELQEPARFHRKQWEFAMIFLALRKLGFLKNSALGLSMGGGNERVLYSIARHIRRLTVTDLYDSGTTWDCARTADPVEYIRASKPFPVDDSKLQVLRMDMRNLKFEDNSFDFCYSSCAFEHIGGHDDFVRHLNEVQRVLKPGGVYVFTTEFLFGPDTIRDPNNYIFSGEYLSRILQECRLEVAVSPNVRLTPHRSNFPLPHNIRNLAYYSGDHWLMPFLENYPHLQLLRGHHPFTSILLVLRKGESPGGAQPVTFPEKEISRNFLDARVAEYRQWLQEKRISLNPFSSLPAGVSRYYADHAEFFKEAPAAPVSDTLLFHSDYFWFGGGERTFAVRLHLPEVPSGGGCRLQLRVHHYATMSPAEVDCVAEVELPVSAAGWVEKQITLPVGADDYYAVLAEVADGRCRVDQIQIESGAPHLFAPQRSNSHLELVPEQLI